MVTGPRQCGKTTLVRGFTSHRYITLDDDTVLQAARSDPSGFVRGLDHAIVDEVQGAPDLLRAIKKTIDVDRRPGRFLLTGSANVPTLPQVSDSLAGRMQVVNLLPLSRAEIGEEAANQRPDLICTGCSSQARFRRVRLNAGLSRRPKNERPNSTLGNVREP